MDRLLLAFVGDGRSVVGKSSTAWPTIGQRVDHDGQALIWSDQERTWEVRLRGSDDSASGVAWQWFERAATRGRTQWTARGPIYLGEQRRGGVLEDEPAQLLESSVSSRVVARV